MSSSKYLYLTNLEWSVVWRDGGDVPISLASQYRGSVRNEVLTVDENNTQSATGVSGDDMELIRQVIVGQGGFHARKVLLPGGHVREYVHAQFDVWDGYILCLSNSASEDRCRRLGKTTCLEIRDPEALFVAISRQLGVDGEMRECSYTETADRDVFTKSDRDSWQDEFRMYWPMVGAVSRMVKVPAGTGSVSWIIS